MHTTVFGVHFMAGLSMGRASVEVFSDYKVFVNVMSIKAKTRELCPTVGETPKVRTKVWKCVERNDFIFVWNDSKGRTADWFPPDIDEIVSREVAYRGKSTCIMKCNIQVIIIS